MNPSYNAQTGDAKEADLLDQLSKNIMLRMNCHAHATVQTFDPVKQTITATINYQKVVFVSNSPGAVPVPVSKDYPVVVGCVVYFPQGGGASLTMPVKKGDQCLIAFNDRDMDIYLAASVVGTPKTGRLHSFSDCFAFVGVNPLRMAISNFDMVRALLKGPNGAVVGVNDKVLISNVAPSGGSYSTTLNTLLQDLLSEIEDLTAAIADITVLYSPGPGGPVPSGPPINASDITAIGSEISSIATEIGELLE